MDQCAAGVTLKLVHLPYLLSSGVVCTNCTTGQLQHKQDPIYLTDYLYIQNQQPEFKKQANGRRYILKKPNSFVLSFYYEKLTNLI
jgi:hypothetical protein